MRTKALYKERFLPDSPTIRSPLLFLLSITPKREDKASFDRDPLANELTYYSVPHSQVRIPPEG